MNKILICALILILVSPCFHSYAEEEKNGMFHGFKYYCIRRAAHIACNAMEAARATLSKAFNTTVTEKDVVIAIEKSLRENGSGAVFPAFRPIVASGRDASFPHGIPENDGTNTIEEGEVVVVDLGARYCGFHSDMTRTFFMGEPTEEMKKIYSIVLEAQEAAIKKVELFAPLREVDKAARQTIERYGYTGTFIHDTGHGLGLRLHAPPLISSSSIGIFLPGEIVTIEPGMYFEGKYGIRIEDDVAVYVKGQEVLTHYPKDIDSVIITEEQREPLEKKEDSKKLYSPNASLQDYTILFLLVAGSIGLLVFMEQRRKILK